MITAEKPGRDPEEHIAIVRTFPLAKATVVCAAEYAALSCPRCYQLLIASCRPTITLGARA